jgi:hypothetical protein
LHEEGVQTRALEHGSLLGIQQLKRDWMDNVWSEEYKVNYIDVQNWNKLDQTGKLAHLMEIS